MCTMRVKCSWRVEEDVRAPGTGVTVISSHLGTWN